MFRKCTILLFVFTFVLSLSSFVLADDFSPTNYNWTGPYVGLNVGSVKAEAHSRTTTTFTSTQVPLVTYLPTSEEPAFAAGGNPVLRSDNFVGGIQGGYNRQFGNFVVGGELDFSYMNINSSETSTGRSSPWLYNTPLTFRSSIDTDWLVTVRPRVGYAFQNFLFYATGGLAITDLKARWSYYNSLTANTGWAPFVESASKSKTKMGWTIGGGVEAGLWKNWTIKGEYLYTDFGHISGSGSIQMPIATILPQTLHHKIDLKTQIIRLGLNYRF